MGKKNFGLKFTNTTSSKQTLKLFELGASGEDVPIQSQIATNSILDIDFGGTPNAWIWVSSSPLPTSSNFELISNGGLRTTATGFANSCVIVFSDSSSSDFASEIPTSSTLITILDEIDSGIREKTGLSPTEVDVTAKSYYNSNLDELRIIFSIIYKRNPLSNSYLNLLNVKQISYPNGGVSMQYNFPTSASDFTYGSWTIGGTITPNGVEVSSQTDTSYEEILQSQNGSVIEIDYLDINTYAGVTDGVRQSQLLNCLKFKKKNANGDDFTYFRCPTIDSYQFQNTLRYVGLNNESDIYTLDGTTQFEYSIEANAVVSLDFEYTNLPNLIFGDKYKIAQKQKEIKNKKALVEEHNKYSQVKIVDVK